jgi:hypothetical protein
MQKNKFVLMAMLIIILASCVQKSSKKTVIVYLNVHNHKNIQSVGVRGEGKPLSWDKDAILTPIVKDSLYTATFTVVTGYKFSEIKFAINGELELNDKPNRKVVFNDKDTTIYRATFNTNL